MIACICMHILIIIKLTHGISSHATAEVFSMLKHHAPDPDVAKAAAIGATAASNAGVCMYVWVHVCIYEYKCVVRMNVC